MKIIILAGGGGTRLWPLSTEQKPKQFVELPGINQSLFSITLNRALLLAEIEDIAVVTSESHKQLVHEIANQQGLALRENLVFGESKRLNTLAAIISGIKIIGALPGEIVLVLPSDHLIEDEKLFVETVTRLKNAISNEYIGVFGITPSSPHSGYGYIEPGLIHSSHIYSVQAFHEKPNIDMAIKYVEAGYLWNSGMFVFETKFFLSLVKDFQKDMFDAFESTHPEEVYRKLHSGPSIDYGIMEHTKKILVAPMDPGWVDIGSFETLSERLINAEEDELIESNNVDIIKTSNRKVVIIGLDDLIVVDHPNGLLITQKGHSQKVNQRKKVDQ
jgi:mannose-1-phosphate guanylyltransferase / mannose-6-phosphate isomerase